MKTLIIKLAYFLLEIANKKTPLYVKYENEPLFNYRRTGRTTRIIDNAIQKLFEDGEITVRDHYGTRQADERVFFIIIDRLEREHGITKDMLELNKSRHLIKLKR